MQLSVHCDLSHLFMKFKQYDAEHYKDTSDSIQSFIVQKVVNGGKKMLQGWYY